MSSVWSTFAALMSKPKMTRVRFSFLQSTVMRAMSQMDLLIMHNSMTLKLVATSHMAHMLTKGLMLGFMDQSKHIGGQERNKLEEERGEVVTKDNFIEVYSQAHLWAITCANIQ